MPAFSEALTAAWLFPLAGGLSFAGESAQDPSGQPPPEVSVFSGVLAESPPHLRPDTETGEAGGDRTSWAPHRQLSGDPSAETRDLALRPGLAPVLSPSGFSFRAWAGEPDFVDELAQGPSGEPPEASTLSEALPASGESLTHPVLLGAGAGGETTQAGGGRAGVAGALLSFQPDHPVSGGALPAPLDGLLGGQHPPPAIGRSSLVPAMSPSRGALFADGDLVLTEPTGEYTVSTLG